MYGSAHGGVERKHEVEEKGRKVNGCCSSRSILHLYLYYHLAHAGGMARAALSSKGRGVFARRRRGTRACARARNF